MRLDHIAYRVADRKKTADFFIKSFGYHVQTEFEINFDDGSSAECFAHRTARERNRRCTMDDARAAWRHGT